jgi:predicted DNA-binding transcriptional regulator AlpA
MHSPDTHNPQAGGFKLLLEREVAERLRISPRHLQRLNEIGEGPPRVRLGDRRVAYPENGLDAWVQQRTTTPKAA